MRDAWRVKMTLWPDLHLLTLHASPKPLQLTSHSPRQTLSRELTDYDKPGPAAPRAPLNIPSWGVCSLFALALSTNGILHTTIQQLDRLAIKFSFGPEMRSER